jgi:hypothetical protein
MKTRRGKGGRENLKKLTETRTRFEMSLGGPIKSWQTPSIPIKSGEKKRKKRRRREKNENPPLTSLLFNL